MTIVSAIFLSVIAAFLADELLGWLPRLSKWLIRRNSAELPKEYRERFTEEWLAHLNDLPGRLSKLFFAINTGRAGYLISHQHNLPHISPWTPVIIRIFDISMSAIMILVAGPILITLTTLLYSHHPFSAKILPGKYKKPFHRVHFRTEAHESDPTFIRYTRIFIRKTSLYDLPVLFQVLAGKMSIIGPSAMQINPKATKDTALLSMINDVYKVKPGLVGYGWLHHPYYSDLSDLRKRFEHDAYFAGNLSIKLVFKTLFSMIKIVLFDPIWSTIANGRNK